MKIDAIVVGSGFGGSVCAARLAERGMRVVMLERGPWWGPLQRHRAPEERRELPRGVFGSRKLLRNLRVARKGRRWEKLFHADGLLESHRFEHISSVTASGVGGGSHIYTAMLEEPAPEFFDAFPAEVSGAEMRPYFQKVREMLRPAPVPEPPPKDVAFAKAVQAAGLPAPEYPALGIVWGADPARQESVTNAAGVEQRTSTWSGDAFVGCQDGSKTTLDLTYVEIALRSGAELRPLCEVTALERDAEGFAVRYRDHRSKQELRVAAPRLVLAAGGLNTQRLLFAARDRHRSLPELPATLGTRFSPNADFASLLWRTSLVSDSSYGPSFGAYSRITRDGVHRYLLGEVGISVDAMVAPAFVKRWLRRSTFLFSMGRDASHGRIGFDGTGLVTDVDRSQAPDLYEEMEQAQAKVARSYEAKRTFHNFLAGPGPGGAFTVHPLGGCSMGDSPDSGFCDHIGQVYGHPGLYVADGSLYPRSPGIGPSMTIAALAERQAALMQ